MSHEEEVVEYHWSTLVEGVAEDVVEVVAEWEPKVVISGGGVVFRVVRSSHEEKPDGAKGVVGEESRGVEGGAT
ncbi:hypothetical protein Tco_0671982 [Tanacetum coccineum]